MLERVASQYGMEISKEKSQILVNGPDNPQTAITIGNQRLQEVESFKYLGSTLTKDGTSTKEVKIRLGRGTVTITLLSMVNNLEEQHLLQS